MRILWHRILAFLLAIAAFVIVITHFDAVVAFSNTIRDLGARRGGHDPLVGMVILGLSVVIVLVAIRLLLKGSKP